MNPLTSVVISLMITTAVVGIGLAVTDILLSRRREREEQHRRDEANRREIVRRLRRNGFTSEAYFPHVCMGVAATDVRCPGCEHEKRVR